MWLKLIITGVFTFYILSCFTQDKGYYGGFRFELIREGSIFTNKAQSKDIEGLHIESSSKLGYSFGMSIRKQFTQVLAIESGLGFIGRNYQIAIDSINIRTDNKINYRLVAYQIPLKVMIRLPSSSNAFFSTSLGGQIDLYPSDVFAANEQWQVEVIRKNWIQASLTANLGWEISNSSKGIYYIGLSYVSPFTPPLTILIGERSAIYGISTTIQQTSYLALDIRYYLNGGKQ